MNKSILTLSAAMLLIVASCSKSNDNPTEETKSCLVSQMIIDGLPDNFTYDQNGNVVEWLFDGGLDKETYTYTGSTIKTKSGATYQLSQGRITSMAITGHSNSYTYSYNAEGYLIEERNVSVVGAFTNVYLVKYTWTNGNLTKSESFADNVPMDVMSLEYSSDVRPSNFVDYNNYTGLDINLLKYFGKQSRNLLSKFTGSHTVNFKYTKDANGNITKSTATQVGHGDSSVEYKYTCK